MSIPRGDYRNPERREHFVYRVYDSRDRLLYVGCTMRPGRRMRQHRANLASWAPLAHHMRMTGPLNYDDARALEKRQQEELGPAYGMTPACWSVVNGRANAGRRRGPRAVGAGAA